MNLESLDFEAPRMNTTTSAKPNTAQLKACPTCGLVQRVPALERSQLARCPRCESRVVCGMRRVRGNAPAFSAALAALILFPFAITMPIMRLEQLGHSTEASIWSGSLGLLREGELFVGGVVLLCSILLPLVKLLGLVVLCTSERFATRHRARFYRAIEVAGRWGMLDVLLIAVVVAWVKMGDLVEVRPGPAALAFTLCVLLSLIASARFDPHALWDDPAGQASPSS